MRRALAGVIVSATLAASACSADLPKPADPDAKSVDAIHAQGRALVPLHERKRPPRQGDWLERSVEAGQTFDQYRASSPNRPCGARTTLYVQPLGPFTPEQARLLDAVKHLLERFYGLPVRELPTLGLEAIPAEAKRVHNTLGPQVHSLTVLNLLKPRRPVDAVAVLCLTASGLYPQDDWNFVFGQASLGERVGVWSIKQLGDPAREFPVCLRRTLSVALHETGHMFGMQHCTAYECGMNGSNSLDESDRQPLPFCPECEMKVWWACRLDPSKRYRSLVEFAEAHELTAEAKTWSASLDAVTSGSKPSGPTSRQGVSTP